MKMPWNRDEPAVEHYPHPNQVEVFYAQMIDGPPKVVNPNTGEGYQYEARCPHGSVFHSPEPGGYFCHDITTQTPEGPFVIHQILPTAYLGKTARII